MSPLAHSCPCCGHLTLRTRGGFEICSVCFWEDDGQDDVDAHLDGSGPMLDGVAVELVPFAVVAAWNVLHDGIVTNAERHAHRVTLVVDIPYLRTRFTHPGTGFRVDLLGCSLLEYAPYEGAPLSKEIDIAQAQANIVEARVAGDHMVVWGSLGVLRLRYEHLVLRFGDGSPVALAALEACARAYWAEWDKNVRQPLLNKKP